MPTRIAEVQENVREWLKSEHSRRFTDDPSYPEANLYRTVRVEMPKRWQWFHRAHEEWLAHDASVVNLRLQRHAARHILGVAATARAVFVWGRVIEGARVDEASQESWEALAAYEQNVQDAPSRLPSDLDLFSAKLPAAIRLPTLTPELAERFTYYGGLATLHLLEAEHRHGMYMMPAAVDTSGDSR